MRETCTCICTLHKEACLPTHSLSFSLSLSLSHFQVGCLKYRTQASPHVESFLERSLGTRPGCLHDITHQLKTWLSTNLIG